MRSTGVRLLDTANGWRKLLGVATTMRAKPGAILSTLNVAHGAALLASPILPNLHAQSGVGGEYPATSAWVRGLFDWTGRSGEPLLPTTRLDAPERSLGPELCAMLCHTLLSRSLSLPDEAARVEAFLKAWQRAAGTDEATVRERFTAGAAAVDECQADGVDPPLAIGAMLAYVWQRATDKCQVYRFVETLSRLDNEFSLEVSALPAEVARDDASMSEFWLSLEFDENVHEQLLKRALDDASLRHPVSTALNVELATAAVCRWRAQGASCVGARHVHRANEDECAASAVDKTGASRRAVESVAAAWADPARRRHQPWLLAALSSPLVVEALVEKTLLLDARADGIPRALLAAAMPTGRAGSRARGALLKHAFAPPSLAAKNLSIERLEATVHIASRLVSIERSFNEPTESWRAAVAFAVFAARAQDVQGADALLLQGIELASLRVAPRLAAQFDAPGWLDRLAALGVDLDQNDDVGLRPLIYAAKASAINSVAYLLQIVPPDQPQNDALTTPLCAAAHAGAVEVVRLLLAHGADPNATPTKNLDGLAPLHFAKNCQIANLLLAAGADPRQRSNAGHTPFDVLPAHVARYALKKNHAPCLDPTTLSSI